MDFNIASAASSTSPAHLKLSKSQSQLSGSCFFRIVSQPRQLPGHVARQPLHLHSNNEHARANTRALYKARVPILAGTDASGTGVGLPYGLGLHMELYALIHHAGLSVEDALKSATSAPADRFKFHDRGRIEKGRKADLVLIRTNADEFLEDCGGSRVNLDC